MDDTHSASEEMAAVLEPISDPALDPRVLAELTRMQRNGRPGFMNRVITLYLQTASELIADLEAASVSDELTVLHRASHTLKPCSATVGALSLAALCETLEQMARAGSVPDPAARVAAIAEEFRRVRAALRGRLCRTD
jgi:HPt (histidine-containing phosphotransfer) domain-containing protein